MVCTNGDFGDGDLGTGTAAGFTTKNPPGRHLLRLQAETPTISTIYPLVNIQKAIEDGHL